MFFVAIQTSLSVHPSPIATARSCSSLMSWFCISADGEGFWSVVMSIGGRGCKPVQFREGCRPLLLGHSLQFGEEGFLLPNQIAIEETNEPFPCHQLISIELVQPD